MGEGGEVRRPQGGVRLAWPLKRPDGLERFQRVVRSRKENASNKAESDIGTEGLGSFGVHIATRCGVSRCRERELRATTNGSSPKRWRPPLSRSNNFRQNTSRRAHMDDIRKLLANGREPRPSACIWRRPNAGCFPTSTAEIYREYGISSEATARTPNRPRKFWLGALGAQSIRHYSIDFTLFF